MKIENEVSWNIITSAYGGHGLLKEPLWYINYQMLELEIESDHVTSLSLISACGLVVKLMKEANTSIQWQRSTNHSSNGALCMHGGFIWECWSSKEAFEIVKGMLFEPNEDTWGCRIPGNVDLAEVRWQGTSFRVGPTKFCELYLFLCKGDCRRYHVIVGLR